MMTIFGLFSSYEEARVAVDELMEKGADESEVNVLVKTGIAKNAMDVNMAQAGAGVSDEVGDVTIHGLDRLVAAEQAVRLPGLGDVYAAGELATLMVPAAQAPRDDGRGLEAAMREFSLTEDRARTYYDGIAGGDWLVFVRTDEDEKAQSLMPVLRKHSGQIASVS